MPIQLSVSIGYRNVFDDYEAVKINELIKDIPTKNALPILGFFLAQLHTVERDSSKQIEFLKIWLSRLPEFVHQNINNFVTKTNKPNADYNFLNNVSALILTEIIIENANELQTVDDLTPSQELNLFKAYLYCSQQWIDKQLPGFKTPTIKATEDLIKILLPTQLPYQEILEFKDFRLQIIKAIYFFKFCESNDEFKEYLSIFLKEYNLKNWQEYIYNLVSIYIRKFERMKTASVINVSNEFPEIRGFLENLCIDTSSFKKSLDFLKLREKPVYKINENEYVFLNLNFLVDKIYQGIQFDFAKVLVKKSATYKGKLIKNTVTFMAIFGDVFSENGLFYSVMNYTFEKSGYKKFKGEEIKSKIIDGEPDYYIRDKSKIYIFEYKNIFLSANVKHSNDYEKIVAEIFKKLVKNQNNSAKGVTQLVNVIEKIDSGEFNKFDEYDFNSAIIYPIIVYVDFSFNLPGVNYLLNKEFKKQLQSKKITNSIEIKDLLLIDLDTFIKFQDLFRNKSLKINNCFNEFYQHTKSTNNIFEQISTFNLFIHNKTDKMEYDTPKMFMEEMKKILPET